MEYINGTYCISYRELIDGGIVTQANYNNWINRDKVTVLRQGKGLGNRAMIAVDSLPEPYRDKVEEIYGGPEARIREWIKWNYTTDREARDYFFDPEKCGIELTDERAREYVTNASVLNTCIRLYDDAKARHRLMGKKYEWGMMARVITTLREEFGHTLPTSIQRFQKKVSDYRKNGYSCLMSGKFGNQNTRKVNFKVERLILSLAIQMNRPWHKDVHMYYNQFVNGELAVWDYETGEMINREEYRDRKGKPLELSEATIGAYLNNPRNQILLSHRLDSYTTFMHETMPHMHRHRPEFSLSKVSFDDRDLPRKLKDTKQRPKAYYAYDVASDCCIGFAYNRSKNVNLVVDMFRNMFRLLDRNGWGTPAEVEVENHLMSQWRDSFLKAEEVFPFVRFCAPMNSQEKHSENCNGVKKISIEHRNHIGVGRFFAKRKAYRTESVKVFDELNNTYTEKNYYTWDELIADDMKDIMEYNNSLHHNQKKYPGMTRWEVFINNINPALKPLDKGKLALYIGEKVSTSIRRNSYCRVADRDWWISGTEVMGKLAPNNYKVDAYCLTDEDGEITDVYIYQGDKYIDRLSDIGTYCTARAEQTEEDERIFTEQRKKIARFNSFVEENAIPRVGIMEYRKKEEPEAEDLLVETPIPEPACYDADEEFEFDNKDYGNAGLMAV